MGVEASAVLEKSRSHYPLGAIFLRKMATGYFDILGGYGTPKSTSNRGFQVSSQNIFPDAPGRNFLCSIIIATGELLVPWQFHPSYLSTMRPFAN